MTGREFKDIIFHQFAQIASAFASPKRLEIIDILSQSERDVESLSKQVAMTVANTSRHLQILKNARLVKIRREGVRIIYSLADAKVKDCWKGLQILAEERSAEIREVVNMFFTEKDALDKISMEELRERFQKKEVELIDVRPAEEYNYSHITSARSVPLNQLKMNIHKLSRDRQIVAYCRGRYCVLSAEAVQILKEFGFHALRLEEGLFEWQKAGLPIE